MTDNYWKGCPPKMSDGRFLTDYRTAVRREEYIKQLNGFIRDDEYRMFLVNNASDIANNTWSHLRQNNSCWLNECVHNYPTRVNPAQFVEERKNYDQLRKPHEPKFVCKVYRDYRFS
jgi:hypothetical protein